MQIKLLRVKLGGHNIPQADVERRFERSLHNLYALYLPLADRWTVLDNAMGKLKPIAHGTASQTYVENIDKWLNLKKLSSGKVICQLTSQPSKTRLHRLYPTRQNRQRNSSPLKV